MKKLILAFVGALFLCLIFPASLLADDLSPEQRANLQDQFSSIPIGEGDPWDEIESALPPLVEEEDQFDFVLSATEDEVDDNMIVDIVINFITSVVLDMID
ncbi:MAG: hypothetical protein R3F48_05620 [Candidatus Zixiibacteriota bacterium]